MCALSGCPVQVDFDSEIEQVTRLDRPPATDDFIAPGFIDLQVNGFAGVDYNDPDTSSEAIAASVRSQFRTGVTRFFPTIITAPEETILQSLRRLISAKQEFLRCGMREGDAIAGFHIEGPHISAEDGPRGAHPAEFVRPPDLEEFWRWQEAADGEIRLVTLSPEYETAIAYIARLVREGVIVSIGHTRATSDQIRAAVDAGATMSTHLGNGSHAMLPKTANYVWEQLAEDRLVASFIVDGIHLPESFFKSALRVKGFERCVLVTDAVMPSMCKPGTYRLGKITVELLPDGRVVLPAEKRLAGSGLSMDRAVGNCVRFGSVGLKDAVMMATSNPAIAAGIPGRQRGMAAGEKADLIRFRWDEDRKSVAVLETVISGQTVYSLEK
jgi:N-acetylglucosamine-6-phosphate deacetylase